MPASFAAAAAIAIGAALGALLRWGLTLALAPLSTQIPLGTLAANLVGGLLMGLVIGLLPTFQEMPVALQLALTTGFLGGLTTFSAFAGETVTLMLRGNRAWSAASIVAHVSGSLIATLAVVGLGRLALRH